MKKNIRSVFGVGSIVLILSGCSTVKSGVGSSTHHSSAGSADTSVCQERTIQFDGRSCEYTFCALSVSGYPNQVAVALPRVSHSDTAEVRVHFHGFSHFKNGAPYHSQYFVKLENGYPQESIEKTMNAFGANQSACGANPQVTIMPMSFGQGDDFRKAFKSYSDLSRLVNNVGEELTLNLKGRPIHFSGHQAGGQLLVDLLAEEGKISNARSLSLYEGLYRSSSLEPLKNWINVNPGVKVFSYTLSMGEAYRNTRLFFGQLSNEPKDLSASELFVGRAPASESGSRSQVVHIKVSYSEKKKVKEKADPYSIVKMFWAGQ